MVQEHVFSFLNKIRSSRVTDASLVSLSKLSAASQEQMPVLNADAVEFYSVWNSKESFPLKFFIDSLSLEQQKDLLKKYENSQETDKPLSFFIGLGLIRGPGKRIGSALFVPVNFNPQTKELSNAGDPVENPVLSETEGFPEPESALVQNLFSLQEYFRRLKIFFSSLEGWKFTEKGVSLSLFPTESFYAVARIGRLFRNLESDKMARLSEEILGDKFPVADEASFEASKFRKKYHPADHVFPYPYDAEDTDGILKALDEDSKYFILEPLPGTDNGKTVANLVAEAIHQNKRTAVIASRPVSLQMAKEGILPTLFSDAVPDFEKLEKDLREKRKPFEDYYSLIHPNKDETPLAEIMQELAKHRKKGAAKLSASISSKMEKLSLEQCKKAIVALESVAAFKNIENSKEKEEFFSVLNERAFNNNAFFAEKLQVVVSQVENLKQVWGELIRSGILEDSAEIGSAKKIIQEFKEIITKEPIDFPDWNLDLQDWETFKETILAFPKAGKVWSDYRNQGSNEFTPNAIDTNIWIAKETFAQIRVTRMKHMSENYLSAKKLLKSTLRDPKIASSDEDLQKYADILWEIQESRNTYKNSAALAQRLFGRDWNYEKTNWRQLEKKIDAYYTLKESSPSSFKLSALKQAYLFKDSVQELDELLEGLSTYETLLNDLFVFLKQEAFPKKVELQWSVLLGVLENLTELKNYEECLQARHLLQMMGLECLISDSSLIQDKEVSRKLMQAWIALALQRLAKKVPDLFSKTAKTRIKESKEYRKAYDLWSEANLFRIRETLKSKPELLNIISEKKLVAAPRCDILIILDAEMISVVDFLLYAQNAKKVIFVGDENLPAGTLDSGGILLHVLRLGAPRRNISFAFGYRHPQMLQFASSHFYDNGIRTFPLPDLSRERPLRKHYSNAPQNKLIKGIIRHAESNPARTLGVIAFSKEEVKSLKDMLQNAISNLPNISSFFKERGFRNTFYISTPENAIGKKRDTIFLLADGISQGTSEGVLKINACSILAERELHFFVSESASISQGETGKLFQELLDFIPRESQLQETEVCSPILQELESYSLQETLSIRKNIGSTAITLGLGVLDENNDKRYLLAAEDDSMNGSLQQSIEDREYIRPKSAEMLGWKIVRIWTPIWYVFNNDEKNHFLTTVKIEQSIAPPKVEVEETELEEEESSPASLVVPYQMTHPKIAGTVHDKPILELSEKALLHQLRFYVESESPIHEQQLLWRMFSLHKISRPGPKILECLQEGIHLALQQKLFVKTGPFFYSRTTREIQPRYRGELPDTERLLQYVSPEERALLPSDEAVIKEMLGLL